MAQADETVFFSLKYIHTMSSGCTHPHCGNKDLQPCYSSYRVFMSVCVCVLVSVNTGLVSVPFPPLQCTHGSSVGCMCACLFDCVHDSSKNINILICAKAEIQHPCSKIKTSPTPHRITQA